MTAIDEIRMFDIQTRIRDGLQLTRDQGEFLLAKYEAAVAIETLAEQKLDDLRMMLAASEVENDRLRTILLNAVSLLAKYAGDVPGVTKVLNNVAPIFHA